MLTVEVYGKLVTWPVDTANFMMKHYRDNGIAFEIR